MSIQLVVEFPLEDLQTGKAKTMDITTDNVCCICGKKISGHKYKMVQLLTNGNIVSTDQSLENSQGFFHVGAECTKKLILKFAF